MKKCLVITAFNRPQHLEKTLQSALKHCENIPVWIFIDGPRGVEDVINVKTCKDVAIEFKNQYRYEAKIFTSDENRGLAQSIINAANTAFSIYEYVIFLEDDIVTSKEFYKFMDLCAEVYEHNANVMQVSGFNYNNKHVNTDTLKSYFLPFTTSWGWATWRRAWQHFNNDHNHWQHYFSSIGRRRRFDAFGGFYNQLQRNYSGTIHTWAVFWYATVFEQQGLVIYPETSLIKNIGHDGTGENCGTSNLQNVNLLQSEFTKISFPENDKISKLYTFNIVYKFVLQRLKNKIKKAFFYDKKTY